MKEQVRYGVRIALIAGLYFVAAKLALSLAIPPGYATPVWASSGIAVAALLLFGWRYWPGVWVGAALANFTIQYSVPLAASIATGNTLEAVTAALLMQRYVDARHCFERGEDVVKFVAAALASCAVAATVATLSLGVGEFMEWQDLARNWWTWWQGDVAGVIIVTPLVLSWSRSWPLRWSGTRIAEIAVLAVALVAATLSVFAGRASAAEATSMSFLLLPFIIWVAFRFTQREVATASAAMCGIAVWATLAGYGPFAADSLNRSLLLLQAFISTVVVTGLVLAAVIEERRRASERLREANEDLERFVNVAAHDLQEPLRNVVNFADLLSARNRHRLDGEAREFLDFIVGGVARMQRVLRDLLQFSQVDRKAAARDRVDCEKALASVIEGMRLTLDEARAVVTHDPLPVVTADFTHVELLFQNLIGNAVRYRGSEPPRIHVGARLEGGSWVFSVRDNGIGINPKYFDLIFGMFQRLHGGDRYPGSGMGLTICKRIVERHHGRMWLESREGAGATFYFTFPAGQG